ncbi:HNH endonuclease signature motif containing protein [Bacillus swezeyi]|uniref:HNH endonuclease signature motif containing protein n=1 Tax=Bacillus swezeyi TaxID=1925020 RepID=UPI002E21EDD0
MAKEEIHETCWGKIYIESTRKGYDYEVHHVIPLKYGGINDLSNFFSLKKQFHQKQLHLGGVHINQYVR